VGGISIRQTHARITHYRRADLEKGAGRRHSAALDARDGSGEGQGGSGASLDRESVEGWSDGSRVDGMAAGATRTKGMYLVEWVTVADAEEIGVLLAWEGRGRVYVALDSQGVIQRIWNLQNCQSRSRIEETLVKQMRERPRALM